MPIISLEQAKTFLKISDTSNDDLIEALIPEIEADYLAIRNAPFDVDAEGNTAYPGGSALTAALMLGFILEGKFGIQSETLADHSWTREAMVNGYPHSIVGKIKRYLKFV